jgi:ferredoxin-type protein NapH
MFFLAAGSTVFLSPAYCSWGCPFRAISEFLEVSSPLILIQTVIFFALFIGLVIVLPVLTRKRTQCTFLCPFGVMQSLMGKINPFYVKIDKDKCSECGRCINECPVMAIDKHGLLTGKVKITCVKRGRCMDNCPKKAIGIHIKGTPSTSFTSGLAKKIFNQ